VPLHDLYGNVAAAAPLLGGDLETYRYTAFGEEDCWRPPTENPWRFSSKRTDDETGLVYYGRRYYIPSLGRWLTPDPLGLSAGPNLYAFVCNDPLVKVDFYGLFPMYCGNPWVQSYLSSAKNGTTDQYFAAATQFRRTIPYTFGKIGFDNLNMMAHCGDLAAPHGSYFAHSSPAYMDSWRQSFQQTSALGHGFMQNLFSVDPSHSVSQMTSGAIEAGLAAYGVAALAKTGIGAMRNGMGYAANRCATRSLVSNSAASESLLAIKEPFKLNRFHAAARSLSEVGQNNIRSLRGWAKSKGWEKMPNPQGAPEKWGVYQNEKFEWRLRIKPEPGLRTELHEGSKTPRFDARVGIGGNQYVNPFTGEIGSESIGTHLPLECSLE